MASDAITAQRCSSLTLGRLLLVAGLAAQLDVFAVESVLGFRVVIEIP